MIAIAITCFCIGMCHGRSDVMKKMELAGWSETLYPGITFIYGPRRKNNTRYELSRLDSAMTDVGTEDVDKISAPRTSSNTRLVRGGSGSSSFNSSSVPVGRVPVVRSRLIERQSSSMSSDGGTPAPPNAPPAGAKEVIRFDESRDPFETRTPSSPPARAAVRPPSFEDSASAVPGAVHHTPSPRVGDRKTTFSFKKMFSSEEEKIVKDDYDWI
jgi:hypothetical protein